MNATDWQALQLWLDELDEYEPDDDIPDIDDSLSAAEGIFNALWLSGLVWCIILISTWAVWR